LAVEATLPDTSYARDLVALMERRDMDSMSFVFKPAANGQSWTHGREGRQRSLTDVDLFDVAIVTLPAYHGTDADLEFRSLYSAFFEARAGRKISTASREQIQSAIDVLSSLLGEEDTGTNPRALKLDLLERYN
jgi:phage head maturation protease